jgi:hypothetical protein
LSNYLNLDPSQIERLQKKIGNKDKNQFLFFRLMGPMLQKRIAELIDLEDIPKVFIHGNPHLDNYAKTFTGAGMVDFDRSRLGPYVWDIVRFYASLALRREDGVKTKLPQSVYDAFIEGYLSRLYNSDLFYLTPALLSQSVPGAEELTTRAYLEANIKWAKKMKKNPVGENDKKLMAILKGYLESRNDTFLLKKYSIASAGIVPGSLGKEHYIIVLTPNENPEKYDDILIDIKETYNEEDDEWFSNPAEHHGLRMIKASMLYAPGVETRLGYCTYKAKQYWGREVPSFKAKLPQYLDKDDLHDVAYTVGTQLGRGHRRSCKEFEPTLVEKHFLKNSKVIQDVSEFLNKELLLGYEFFEKSQELKNDFKKKVVRKFREASL